MENDDVFDDTRYLINCHEVVYGLWEDQKVVLKIEIWEHFANNSFRNVSMSSGSGRRHKSFIQKTIGGMFTKENAARA